MAGGVDTLFKHAGFFFVFSSYYHFKVERDTKKKNRPPELSSSSYLTEGGKKERSQLEETENDETGSMRTRGKETIDHARSKK